MDEKFAPPKIPMDVVWANDKTLINKMLTNSNDDFFIEI
jgi:hypothetical protein